MEEADRVAANRHVSEAQDLLESRFSSIPQAKGNVSCQTARAATI